MGVFWGFIRLYGVPLKPPPGLDRTRPSPSGAGPRLARHPAVSCSERAAPFLPAEALHVPSGRERCVVTLQKSSAGDSVAGRCRTGALRWLGAVPCRRGAVRRPRPSWAEPVGPDPAVASTRFTLALHLRRTPKEEARTSTAAFR